MYSFKNLLLLFYTGVRIMPDVEQRCFETHCKVPSSLFPYLGVLVSIWSFLENVKQKAAQFSIEQLFIGSKCLKTNYLDLKRLFKSFGGVLVIPSFNNISSACAGEISFLGSNSILCCSSNCISFFRPTPTISASCCLVRYFSMILRINKFR